MTHGEDRLIFTPQHIHKLPSVWLQVHFLCQAGDTHDTSLPSWMGSSCTVHDSTQGVDSSPPVDPVVLMCVSMLEGSKCSLSFFPATSTGQIGIKQSYVDAVIQ